MYLITGYFDDDTTKNLQGLIDEICDRTGNDFMIKNHVPPHMTISAFEQKNDDAAIELFEKVQDKLISTDVIIPSVGEFFPYVIYAQVTKNRNLLEMSRNINAILSTKEDTRLNRFYEPYDWIPHITLGKQLNDTQMQTAFLVLQKYFQPVKGKLTRFALSKPTPYRELVRKDTIK